jgi:hypothetical protein
LVEQPNGGLTSITDEPRLVTRQRGVNDELIHFPNTFGTSYRFVDLQNPEVNCRFHETCSSGNSLYDWGNARLRTISHGSRRRGSDEWGLTTGCKFFGTLGGCNLRGAAG